MNRIKNSVKCLSPLILLFSSWAQAGLVISSVAPGLDIEAGIEMISEAGDLDGATQNASMELMSSNIQTTSDITGLAVTGSNPLQGSLLNLDDGIGLDASVAGADAETDFYFDIFVDLMNNSIDDYIVDFQLDYSAILSGTGADAFAEIELNIEDMLDEIFGTTLLVDTVFGNEIDGDPTGNDGGTMIIDNSVMFSINLAAGMSESLTGLWDLRGGDFDQGSFAAELDVFLSVVDVHVEPGTPNEVPEPGFGLFLLGLGIAVRFRFAQLTKGTK
ncbi:hypothetical protein [uncultured Paraglaciecola sp.]|uniref:hypothetical protein n=1 Tax=uncultured Paraglaciecola sp. TaxID=1765024 RepID=UPI0026125DB1|nr:hypothetical protein [uncultured Paraglaciecola sp.]